MNNERPLVSFCIPTRERTDLLKATLDSIFENQNCISSFEVVVSDNSSNENTKELVAAYKTRFPNILFAHSSQIGFLNSLSALDLGKGYFLKLHNNYTKVLPGRMSILIDHVKQNLASKNGLLFTNGELKRNKTIPCKGFDSFIRNSSYWNSWSSAFGIWREDYLKIEDRYETSNPMFPHTSVLFKSSLQKEINLVVDLEIFKNQDVPRKGGYNIFKTFAVDYPNLLLPYLTAGAIRNSTYCKVMADLMRKFFVPWTKVLLIKKDENFTFETNNWWKYLLDRYKCKPILFEGFLRIVIYALAFNAMKTFRKNS